MAISNRSTSQNNSEMASKAIGYFNVTIKDSNGKSRKVDSLQLTAGNAVHEQIDDALRSASPDRQVEIIKKLFSGVFEISYNAIDDTAPDLRLEDLLSGGAGSANGEQPAPLVTL